VVCFYCTFGVGMVLVWFEFVGFWCLVYLCVVAVFWNGFLFLDVVYSFFVGGFYFLRCGSGGGRSSFVVVRFRWGFGFCMVFLG